MAQTMVVMLVTIYMLSILLVLANASDPDPVQDFCIPNNNSIPHFHTHPCKPLAEVTPEDFIFSRMKPSRNFSEIGFSGLLLTPSNFPSLNTLGISIARADLRVGGVNVPHLHPRASEVVYVVRGSVYSGFVDSSNRVFAKVIEAGDVMIYPRGLVHFQMNVGRSKATMIASFNSQNPGIIKIPNVLFGAGINDDLLEKAFGISIEQISTIRKKFLPKRKIT